MKKYEKMLEVNRKRNQEKEQLARKAIFSLKQEGLPISVATLVQRTGLSRGYFYKMKEIRDLWEKEQATGVQEPVGEFIDPRDKEIEKLKAERDYLIEEKKRLEQVLKKYELGFLTRKDRM